MDAASTENVCAVQRRIVRSGGRVRAVVCPAMGASKYVARTVLAAMHHDGGLRAALNILYSEDVLEVVRSIGLAMASLDRAHEPGGVSTMEWGTRTAIDTNRKLHNQVPDVVFDPGAVGKEPMVRLLVHRAVDAAVQRRIVRSGGRVRAMGCPTMGASRHVARTVLAAMHHDGGMQAALNIRYSKDVLKGKGLAVASFNRAHELGA